MTDAHAKAVEAAVARFALEYCRSANEVTPWPEIQRQAVYFAVQDYLAAMRAEGWVMVRDVGGTQPATVPWRYGDAWDGIQDGVGIGTLDALCNGYADGWNACRAAMLKGAGDGQG